MGTYSIKTRGMVIRNILTNRGKINRTILPWDCNNRRWELKERKEGREIKEELNGRKEEQ